MECRCRPKIQCGDPAQKMEEQRSTKPLLGTSISDHFRREEFFYCQQKRQQRCSKSAGSGSGSVVLDSAAKASIFNAETTLKATEADTWSAQSKRSLARLFAHYLICEDPQRRLDAREVITLSHQVSLVRHVLDHEHLRHVMIADEVGLGKTVEAGLLIQELLAADAGLRVLYLAPARLVNNVGKEFDRLGLNFRLWKAGEADARLSDPRIIASIHRAVHGDNFKKIVNTGPWDVIVVDECHHLSDRATG